MPERPARAGRLRRVMVALVSAACLGIVLILAGLHVIGGTWQRGYTLLMERQLAWTAPRYPSLKPLWAVLKAPLVDLKADTSLLLPAGTPDPLDPTAALAAGLPERKIKAFLKGRPDGSTIILPPGRYTDCAVTGHRLMILKAEKPGTVQLDGGRCQGKGALVAQGGMLVVDGLVFKNIRVSDGNGAGIRLDRGSLIVRNAIFYNSENGILATGSNSLSTVLVEDSQFIRLGSCGNDGGCAHSIYAVRVRALEVNRSVFRHAAGGHFIKSRGATTLIRDSVLDDSDGISSYLIDLSNGSSGDIVGNAFIKGERSRNRCCLIRVGAEGANNSSAALRIAGNSAAARMPVSVFVWNSSNDPVSLGENDLGWNLVGSIGPVQQLEPQR